jgi:serine/threonine protein kinase
LLDEKKQEIGRGSTSKIYLVENKSGAEYAMKQLIPNFGINGDLFVSKINCKYINKLIDFGNNEKGNFLILDLCKYGSLKELIEKAKEKKINIPKKVKFL